MKKPFALLLNDIHADKDGLEEFKKNWYEAVDVAVENDIPRLIIGGDLLESRASISLSVIKTIHYCLIDAVRKVGEVWIFRGNHDLVNQEDVYSYCTIFGEINGVHELDTWQAVEVARNKVMLYLCGYYPEDGSASALIEDMGKKIDASNPDIQNILYCHWGINGAISNPKSAELPIKLFRKFDKVLVGHYHDRCQIKNSNIEYIGASRQANYGEDEEKGYTILFDDGSTEFIKNEVNIRYKTVTATLENVNEVVAGIKELDDPMYRVKVKVLVPKDKELDKTPLEQAGVARIEIVNEDLIVQETTSQNLEVKFDKNGIKSEYVKHCETENIDPQLGLQYLDKI